jgi:hypothetical protein
MPDVAPQIDIRHHRPWLGRETPSQAFALPVLHQAGLSEQEMI